MPTVLTKQGRAKALTALKLAEEFIQGVKEDASGDALKLAEMLQGELSKVRSNAAFVLALLADEDMPAEFFRPWASVRSIRNWRDAGDLTTTIKHGRVCCKPSVFFAHWRTLPDETKS